MKYLKELHIANGVIWIFLGLLIFVWLITSNKIVEFILWAGFAIGCILGGLVSIGGRSKTDSR